MVEVTQQIIDKGDGDCFRASVASLFDLTIEQVPHFNRFGNPGWWLCFVNFIEFLGYELDDMYVRSDEKHLIQENSLGGYFLASVKSKNYLPEENIEHSVILNLEKKVVMDPHPGKAWLGLNPFETNDFVDIIVIRRKIK